MYEEYQSVYSPSLNINVQQPKISGSGSTSTSHSRIPSALRELGSSVLSKKLRKPGSSSSSTYLSNVDVYINTSFKYLDSDDFNILHWWRDHHTNFSILVVIAKQIFETPVSTVAIKQEFSAGGNILYER
ncbi:hypothetical protein ACOSQ2_031176 [Xanthoceras sorbifolium]